MYLHANFCNLHAFQLSVVSKNGWGEEAVDMCLRPPHTSKSLIFKYFWEWGGGVAGDTCESGKRVTGHKTTIIYYQL